MLNRLLGVVKRLAVEDGGFFELTASIGDYVNLDDLGPAGLTARALVELMVTRGTHQVLREPTPATPPVTHFRDGLG